MKWFYALIFCVVYCLSCGSDAMPWPSICCLQKNTSFEGLHVKNVVDCKVQSVGLCPFDAIIIKTLKDRTLCFDPTADWVTKHIVRTENNSCDIQKKSSGNQKAGRGRKRMKRKRKQERGNVN